MKDIKNKANYQQKRSNDLIERAEKTMLDYNQATGSGICLYDKAFKPYIPEEINFTPVKTICSYCIKSRACHEMHIKAIEEANKKGSFHAYQCKAGFHFWTSPIYCEENVAGALKGGGFVSDRKKTVDILLNANDTFVMCNSEISKEEILEHVNSTPEADGEKVQSLGEMIQLCAESLSSGSEDQHEKIRRRAEQQETITKIIDELKKQHGENGEKPGYRLDKEKLLMAALRKGDTSEAKNILNELLAALFFSYPGQFKFVQLRIMELVVLSSRVEISPARSGTLSMEINSQNLKLVQEAKTTDELTDIIHTIVERVAGTISSFQGIPHAAALRKAENFILENFVKKISLKEIAAVAGLSPPYFSTIFKEEMGENLSKYLNRLRVEKASHLLLETEMSLSEIAACCCFEDQSWFSKIFKAYTGISPGKYRNQGGGIIRDIGKNNLSQTFDKTVR
jgi:AraC-like DNA-binding protein/ligand-binding sensor protein